MGRNEIGRYELGIDVGGTFTDVVVAGEGDPLYLKVPTRRDDQAASIHEGITAAAERLGLSCAELLGRTDRIVHGTTIATNMMLEGNGSRVGLITTAGFRDDLEYRRGLKEAIYDPTLPPPRPLVRRRYRKTVPERVAADGSIVTPLDESALRERIRELREAGCESLAVGFLFSFLDDAHERRVREIVSEEWPEVYLSLSSEVLPQVREYERFSTTAVNAYVGPKTVRYLEHLEADLATGGFDGEFLLIQSNGGVVDGGFASLRPVALLLSGPAGGVLATNEMVAKRTAHRNLITVDMGGTSFDVCLIDDATPNLTSATYVERHAVALPMIGVHTIGAGGGSIARVGAGGILRVGPESAGATPGPACYGRGGALPTVTDANLVLGFLDPDATLGGSVKLDAQAARKAIEQHIAEPLGLSVEAAAQGILRMVDSQMTNGIRVVSVQQGHDPRDFALVAFGGNGAVHAGRLAEELEIDTLLVPRMAGALSAWGGLHTDARVDQLATWIGRCDDADLAELGLVLAELAARGASALPGEGLQREAELACHYAGQTSEIWVPLALEAGVITRQALADAAECFHQAHERERSFAKREEAVQIIGLKLTSRRPQEQPRTATAQVDAPSATTPAATTTRDVCFGTDTGWQPTPIHRGSELSAGARIEGPAIVQEPDTTIVVHPGWSCLLDDAQIYHLTHEPRDEAAGREAKSGAVDGITVEVIRSFLETVADEMSVTMKRTAVTPIFSESSDYSCAVMDGSSRLIAQAMRTASLPVHMGAMKFSVEAVLADFEGDIHEGDIFLINDPYHGGSHIPDLTMVMPAFHEGELVLFPAVRAHQMDTGALTPGSYSPKATEIWHEGLRLPPIRICDAGRMREDLIRMLELNTRLTTYRGDLMAMLAACRIGRKRIAELIQKYGTDIVRSACDEAIAQGVRRIRAEVAGWPDGEYMGRAFLDHDGMGNEDIGVCATLRIAGDQLMVDLTGSHEQVGSYVNSSKANTYSNVYLAVATMMDSEIPKNESFFEAVEIVLPSHSVVNADPPAPVTACTLNIGGEIAEAVAYAFEGILPERVYPQTLKIGALVMSFGAHPETGELFLDANIDSGAGWSSAVRGMDGWGGLPNHYGMSTLANAEIVEMRYPYRVAERELVPDTGGPGQWRGSCGTRAMKHVLSPMFLNFSAIGRRWPVKGIAGGRDGSPNCWMMDVGGENEREETGLGYLVSLPAESRWSLQLGGGGGWGDPLEREPQAVLDDVLDGYVSVEGALRDYGVVLRGEAREIDHDATRNERATRRGGPR